MKILSIVGVRPNFVKVAPLHRAFLTHPSIESKIIHTGQHYDTHMSDVFFSQLDLPHPDYCLGVRAGSTARPTADIVKRFNPVLDAEQPDWVVVVGDVTSTLACALAAARRGIRIAHVEAGLRSGDRQMPEERNRIVTDSLASLLFVTEKAGCDNLRRERVADSKIHLVGNIMIDSLVQYRPKATAMNTVGTLGLQPQQYILLTMHRPSNVDTRLGLERLIEVVKKAALLKLVVFPVHPRTRANLIKFDLYATFSTIPNVRILKPQGYLEFLNLMDQAALVITDSGGVPEETTYLQVPCLSFRNSTERPATIEYGTNQLVADLNPETLGQMAIESLEGPKRKEQIPPLWDGQTAERIAQILSQQP